MSICSRAIIAVGLILAACTSNTNPRAQETPAPASTPQLSGTPAASPTAFVRRPLQPAPSPAASGSFGFGKPASQETIQRINIDIRPDGQGLPAGGGTASEGRAIFTSKCASCHGANGEGSTIGPKLIDATPYQAGKVTATVGNYWPYATTVWDYINRAMPYNAPGSLSANEVYALTAFLLSQNRIIGENDRMDATSLPAVQMPNRNSFTSPDPRPDTPPAP